MKTWLVSAAVVSLLLASGVTAQTATGNDEPVVVVTGIKRPKAGDPPPPIELFVKPPRHGGVVAWHQDYSYWTRTQPLAHLTCWIALDDATVENGCLRYVPGSHKWPLLPITGLAGGMNAIESVLTEEQRAEFKPVAIEIRKGEASFHHPLMVHGSSENRSDRPRRGAVINVVRDGVRSATDEPLLQGIPPLPAGAPLGGRFFPLLHR